jgi:hypothetical protein
MACGVKTKINKLLRGYTCGNNVDPGDSKHEITTNFFRNDDKINWKQGSKSSCIKLLRSGFLLFLRWQVPTRKNKETNSVISWNIYMYQLKMENEDKNKRLLVRNPVHTI